MRVSPTLAPLLCSLLVFVAPARAAEPAPVASDARAAVGPRPPAPVPEARGPRPAQQAEIARYTGRQAASPRAAQYEGGDSVVIIGASTLTVALAIILLVVVL